MNPSRKSSQRREGGIGKVLLVLFLIAAGGRQGAGTAMAKDGAQAADPSPGLASATVVPSPTPENAVTPRVQLVEMIRDQPHSYLDIALLSILAETTYNQGTKVNPDTGKPDNGSDAVDVFSFLNDRLLAGADYYTRYHMGEPVTWIPIDMGDHINGARYPKPPEWGILYNYYKYIRKWDTNDPRFHTIAEVYEAAIPEKDGGNDFLGNSTLLFTPDDGIIKE